MRIWFLKSFDGGKKCYRISAVDTTSVIESSSIDPENHGNVDTYPTSQWWVKELAVVPCAWL